MGGLFVDGCLRERDILIGIFDCVPREPMLFAKPHVPRETDALVGPRDGYTPGADEKRKHSIQAGVEQQLGYALPAGPDETPRDGTQEQCWY